ncbi:MAG: peroxide stress protein YaaA [Roseburia sp.]
MKIIISPAKKMRMNTDDLPCAGLPVLLMKTEKLMAYLKGLSHEERKHLWQCNDAIARQNTERLEHMDLARNLTPAILSYEGIQYQYMAPQILPQEALDYLQEHLRILSGFYGILRPLDGITPYRLEMQAKVSTDFCRDLYDFWGKDLYQDLIKDDNQVLNLASKEYGKNIEPFVGSSVLFVTCVFGELKEGKVKVKATLAKMARGEMVRFLAEHGVRELAGAKEFTGLGFSYDEARSTDEQWVFVK